MHGLDEDHIRHTCDHIHSVSCHIHSTFYYIHKTVHHIHCTMLPYLQYIVSQSLYIHNTPYHICCSYHCIHIIPCQNVHRNALYIPVHSPILSVYRFAITFPHCFHCIHQLLSVYSYCFINYYHCFLVYSY